MGGQRMGHRPGSAGPSRDHSASQVFLSVLSGTEGSGTYGPFCIGAPVVYTRIMWGFDASIAMASWQCLVFASMVHETVVNRAHSVMLFLT